MKRLIIIGGGFAGAYIAKKLQKKFATTLIDTKDYFEFTPSVLRTLVEPEHAAKIQICHKSYLTNATVIAGRVTLIREKEVLVGKKSIPFDYLVISSGSHYNAPFKEKNLVIGTRAHHLKDYTKKLETARKILLIGGGLVSVELAAEILTHFKGKQVTIVHSRERLMQRQPQRASSYAERFLRKHGVEIIYNERVSGSQNGTYYTNTKRKIKADLAFLCTGIVPNCIPCERPLNLFVKGGNFLIVNKYLQLGDCTSIFAAGDIIDTGEEKTAQNAEEHAKIVVKNLLRLEKEESLVPYLAAARIMVISLGKYDGIVTYKNFVLGGIIPGILKTLIEWKTMVRYRFK